MKSTRTIGSLIKKRKKWEPKGPKPSLERPRSGGYPPSESLERLRKWQGSRAGPDKGRSDRTKGRSIGKKKYGGKITYKMTGGQVVDAGYD